MEIRMPQSRLWYTKKPYPHFDLPLGQRRAFEYVSDPQRVTQHPFYPLIQYNLVRPRIRKCGIADCIGFVKEPKLRTIAYPSHKDGYIFAYYKSLLEGPYEAWLIANGLNEAVTAFRSINENNITLAKKAFDFIKEHPGCEIIATDIESFFDRINHGILKRVWQRFLSAPKLPADHFKVFKAVTRYSIVERHKVYNKLGLPLRRSHKRARTVQRLCTPAQFRNKIVVSGLVQPSAGSALGIGIPQGTSLSPLLPNMYLSDLDVEMHGLVTRCGGRYWRYCDDILIVLPKGSSDAILVELDRCLASLELSRSHEKTQQLNHADLSSRRQLQYLGFIFNGEDALVRSSSIHRYHRKIKRGSLAAHIRQQHEAERSGQPAPYRQQALFNMYSELPLRGTKIRRWKARQKFTGNFTHYMDRAAGQMGSPNIERQRKRALRRLRSKIRKRNN
jgi:hypothetical protein